MTTPHRPRVFLTATLVLLAGTAGFYLGRRPVSEGSKRIGKPEQERVVTTETSSGQTVSAQSRGGVGEPDWQTLVRSPVTLKRNEAMAGWLERLSGSSPARAMELAQAEKNLRLRGQLVAAVLRGWARVAPDEAAAWALAVTELSARGSAMKAVFSGAVDRPDEAVHLGRIVCERDPAGAMDHGMSLIDCLIEAGHGAVASRVALESNPPRQVWVIEAFAKWSALQPEEAARAAAALPEGEARIDALRGTANGWGEVDAGGLSQFLIQLPVSGARRELLGHALRQWVTTDPVAASKWINDVELGPDMDEGVAAVAVMSLLKPDVATGWAESIESPQLRSETLATILREWGRTDPKAAVVYLAGCGDLQPEERRMLGEFFRVNLNTPVP